MRAWWAAYRNGGGPGVHPSRGGRAGGLPGTPHPAGPWCVPFLLFLTLFTVSLPAAPDDSVRIEVQPGYSGTLNTVSPGAWAPLRVIVDNPGEDLVGELSASVRGSPERSVVRVDLPQGSRKAYDVPVQTPEEVDFQTDSDLVDVTITAGPAGRTMAEGTGGLRYTQPGDRMVLVGGVRGDPYGQLGYRPSGEYAGVPARIVVPAAADLLPENVLLYEGVGAVVWDGQDWSSLSSGQVEALRQFIDMGGILLCGSGERWQLLVRSPIADILPVRYEGTSAVESVTGWEGLGVDPPTYLPSVMAAFGPVAEGAEVLLEADGRPLLVRADYGAGRIYQIGVRLGARWWRSWPDHRRFFDGLFRRGGLPDRRVYGDILEERLLTEMRRYQPDLPSKGLIGTLLTFCLLLAVPGGYFLFRRKDLLYGWVFYAVLAGLFGAGIYGVGFLVFASRSAAKMETAVFARAGSRYAVAETGIMLYSPVTASYHVSFPEGHALPFSRPVRLWAQQPRMVSALRRIDYISGRPTGGGVWLGPEMERLSVQGRFPQMSSGRGGIPPIPSVGPPDRLIHVVRFEEVPELEDFVINQWSSRILRFLHVVDLGEGFETELSFGPENRAFRLGMENSSPLELRSGCVLCAWGSGRISDWRTGNLGFSWLGGKSWWEMMRIHGVNPAFRSADLDGEKRVPWIRWPETAVLLGDCTGIPRPFSIDPDPKVEEGRTALSLELPVRPGADGIDLPAEVWEWEVVEYSSRRGATGRSGRAAPEEEGSSAAEEAGLEPSVDIDLGGFVAVQFVPTEASAIKEEIWVEPSGAVIVLRPRIDSMQWAVSRLKLSASPSSVDPSLQRNRRVPRRHSAEEYQKARLSVLDPGRRKWIPMEFSYSEVLWTLDVPARVLGQASRGIMVRIEPGEGTESDLVFQIQPDAHVVPKEVP